MSGTEWLEEFLAKERDQNGMLSRLGASDTAIVRAKLLDDLEEAFHAAGSQTVTAEEAARRTGVHVETVRRMAREKEIDDGRDGMKGPIRVFVRDLDKVRVRARKGGRTQGENFVTEATRKLRGR